MKKTIWTHKMRVDLYARLLEQFGPHRSWAGSRSPIDRPAEFRTTLADLASQFSKEAGTTITPDAVKNQIDWGITVQKEMKDQAHARNYILNKAAALEVGFITSADLPEYMSVRRTV